MFFLLFILPFCLFLFFIFFYTTRTIYHYKKDILRANLFDEYVQLRADEIIKEREPLLKSESKFKLIYEIIFFRIKILFIFFQRLRNGFGLTQTLERLYLDVVDNLITIPLKILKTLKLFFKILLEDILMKLKLYLLLNKMLELVPIMLLFKILN